MYYWDELGSAPALSLSAAVGTSDTLLDLSAAGTAAVGSIVQIDGEVMRVDEVQNSGTRYRVTRGLHNSPAAAHATAALIYPMSTKTAIAPFPPNFFGSPYSGSWSYGITIPNVRIASAELFVTNRIGNSAVRGIYLTSTADRGLRTLSGGQYSIQVEGYLAVDQAAAPAIVVDAAHAVRDVFAVLGTVADAAVGLQLKVDGTAWCTLSVAAGSTTSPAIDGATLPPLAAGSKITLSVLSVGTTYPGADLAVVVRL
jgi:hypothetical protein